MFVLRVPTQEGEQSVCARKFSNGTLQSTVKCESHQMDNQNAVVEFKLCRFFFHKRWKNYSQALYSSNFMPCIINILFFQLMFKDLMSWDQAGLSAKLKIFSSSNWPPQRCYHIYCKSLSLTFQLVVHPSCLAVCWTFYSQKFCERQYQKLF